MRLLGTHEFRELNNFGQDAVYLQLGDVVSLHNAWMRDIVADLIAVAHIAYFIYVVGGCAAIVVGLTQRWDWIRNPWFRLSHLAAVYIVVFENVFNIACPLNTAEWRLRSASQSADEASSGIGGVLDHLLFHTIPGHVLNVLYSALAILLLVAMALVPPRLTFKSKARSERIQP